MKEMKLSNLIQYVNTINSLSTTDISKVVDVGLRKLLTDMHNNGTTPDLNSEFLAVNVSAQKVIDNLKDMDEHLLNLKQSLTVHRKTTELSALRTSYTIYTNFQNRTDKKEYLWGTYIPHLKKHFYDLKTDVYLNKRIGLYASWKYPSAIVRPLDGENVDPLLSSDLLYILEEEANLLVSCKRLFTKEYQDRLCYKVIDENRDVVLLNQLPNNQLGFIFFNEYFNFRPLELIKQYLIASLRILKPGGVVMFTYNNCDLPGAVINFEEGMYCYTPASLLMPLIESLGFEIINRYDKSSINKSWLEIKKPGKLTSIKGGQTLAHVTNIVHQTT